MSTLPLAELRAALDRNLRDRSVRYAEMTRDERDAFLFEMIEDFCKGRISELADRGVESLASMAVLAAVDETGDWEW